MPRPKKSKTGIGTEETIRSSELEDDIQHDSCLLENNVEGSQSEEEAVMISCVKMKLRSFCKMPRLVSVLNRIVIECNQIMLEAYCFANLHILRLFEAGETLPTIDRNFYYRCIMSIGTSKVKSGTLGQDFQESILLFDSLRNENTPKISLNGYNQVLADLSIIMATMASNHLWTNLEARIDKYLKTFHKSLKPKSRREIITALVRTPKANVREIVKNPSAILIAEELKNLMRLPSALQSKKHASLTIPLYIHILRSFEKLRDSQDKKDKHPKLFSILPLKSNFTISHIPISSMMMLGILKKHFGHKEIEGDGRNSNATYYWKKYFNLNAVETSQRKFGNRIITDGYAVSVPLKRVSATCCQNNVQDSKELTKMINNGKVDLICGVDPGISDVVTTTYYESIEELKNRKSVDNLVDNLKTLEVASYSSGMYYEKSKINSSRHSTSKWNEETKHITENSPKGCTSFVERFIDYIMYILKYEKELLEHRMKYRGPRFLRHMYRDKIIDEICDLIAPKDKVVIVGFGDWKLSNKSPISRKTCGPIEDIKKRLRSRTNVWILDIDEYCTSQKCSCCHQVLSNSKAYSTTYTKDGQKTTTFRKIHKMLHCKYHHTDKKVTKDLRCGITWNRDVNASKNILLLTIFEIFGEMRPKAFRRSRKLKT